MRRDIVSILHRWGRLRSFLKATSYLRDSARENITRDHREIGYLSDDIALEQQHLAMHRVYRRRDNHALAARFSSVRPPISCRRHE